MCTRLEDLPGAQHGVLAHGGLVVNASPLQQRHGGMTTSNDHNEVLEQVLMISYKVGLACGSLNSKHHTNRGSQEKTGGSGDALPGKAGCGWVMHCLTGPAAVGGKAMTGMPGCGRVKQ